MIEGIGAPVELTTGPQTLALEVTLAAGRSLADWASFVCNVREDPEWSTTGGPRSGAALVLPEDPDEDGWALATGFPVTSTSTEGDDTVLFSLPGGLSPGVRRYALDCWGIGGAAGEVQLLPATWVTVAGRVRA